MAMIKRTENVILLKVIGTIELLVAAALFYFFKDAGLVALIAPVLLVGFSMNSFYQAHKCYKRQYSPKKED
ncbi:MAG: hypothetical protein PSN44_08515 [Gammaproteobacteria bacterium]|nr:hypothetical protein [Gammaproteobacteria bacterium]